MSESVVNEQVLKWTETDLKGFVSESQLISVYTHYYDGDRKPDIQISQCHNERRIEVNIKW